MCCPGTLLRARRFSSRVGNGRSIRWDGGGIGRCGRSILFAGLLRHGSGGRDNRMGGSGNGILSGGLARSGLSRRGNRMDGSGDGLRWAGLPGWMANGDGLATAARWEFSGAGGPKVATV